MSVWCVWTESGEYEQHSRDLRGVFASQEVAAVHADHLRAGDDYDVVEVLEEPILDEPPSSVPYVRYAAHIQPDGTEDTGLGYYRGSSYDTWSNELKPLDSSRVDPWSHADRPDRYIEVIGSDETLVAAKYERLLTELRRGLSA